MDGKNQLRKGLVLGIVLLLWGTSVVASLNGNEQFNKHTIFDVQPCPVPANGGWMKTFGGDGGSSVQQTSDGGYIILGSLFGAGYGDIWLIKTDTNGNEVWNRTFGGTEWDGGSSVQQTSDGGYIITGTTCSYGVSLTLMNYLFGDVWLIKTDGNGDKIWDKTFGGIKNDEGSSVQQTSDGGYILTGATYSYGAGIEDIWLIKTDANGDEIWNRTFGGTTWDWGSSVQQTSDGGYIITGGTGSFGAGYGDVWLITTDANGDEIWNRTFGGTTWDVGYSVQQTSDGGYIIIGYTDSFGAGSSDVWLIKTDANGDKIWDKTFGGINGDEGYSVQQTSDGGYIITGAYNGRSPYPKFYYCNGWLIKTNSNGVESWNRKFGPREAASICHSVQQTSDGGYIITGSTLEGVWLIKTDSSGRSKNQAIRTPFLNFLQSHTNQFSFLQKLFNIIGQ